MFVYYKIMFSFINLNNLSNKRVILAIFIIFMPFFMLYLGVPSFWEEDDSVRAEISREMFVGGDFLNTYFNYQSRFDKPPFIYWVNSVFYGVFGINEFSSRVGSSLFAILTLVVVYFFGKKLFNTKIGAMSVLILGSSFFYFVNSQLVSVDSAFIFFISLALYYFYIAYADKKYISFIPLGICLGVGTLVKGPVIFILVGLSIVIFLLCEFINKKNRDLVYIKNKYLWLGLFIALAIPFLWYYLIISKYHSDFINEHFIYRMVARFTVGIEGHTGPWYYYFVILFIAVIPWSWFVINTLSLAWFKKSDARFSLMLIWIAVVFIFFTIAQTKLPNYILPLMVPLAILMAFWWNEFIDNRIKINLYVINFLHLLFIFITGYLSFKSWPFFLESKNYSNFMSLAVNLMIFILFAASLIVNNISIYIIKKYNKDYLLLFKIIFISSFITTFFVWAGFAYFSDQVKPVKDLAKDINLVFSDGDLVVSNIKNSKGLVFYFGHEVLFLYDNNKIIEILNNNQKVFIITDQLMLDFLKQNNINYYLLSTHGIGRLISNYQG